MVGAQLSSMVLSELSGVGSECPVTFHVNLKLQHVRNWYLKHFKHP